MTSADSKTMQVPFSFPRAEDNADKNPYVVCVPSSNSEFPLGTSTVKCTATDKSGNEATCDFEVEVRSKCDLSGFYYWFLGCYLNMTRDAILFLPHAGNGVNSEGIRESDHTLCVSAIASVLLRK